MSIGRDIYLDTRLIITKLEVLYPSSSPSSTHPGISSLPSASPDQAALQHLISRWTTEFPGGLFSHAARLMPPDSGFLRNKHFVRDRNQLVAGNPDAKAFTPEGLRAARPAALVEVTRFVEFLEKTLLVDGRDWVLGGGGSVEGRRQEGPSLADIEAVFILHWLNGMPGALPADVIGPAKHPRTFAWIARFDGHVKQIATKPDVVTGEEAAALVLGAAYAEPLLADDEAAETVRHEDPVVAALGLHRGDVVTVWPVDQAPVNKDTGVLVKMDATEMVIELVTAKGEGETVRVHAPKHGFRVVKGDSKSKAKI